MYSLFIDTHGDDILLVVYKDGKVFKFKNISSLQNHCTYAITTLHQLMEESKIKITDIKEIFVVIGPGSFTGVRIGVVIAKTLAYTLKVPIKTITTLALYGVSNNPQSGKLIVVPDQKGYYFTMFNQLNEEVWEANYLHFEEFDKFIKEKKVERMVLKDNLVINLDYVYAYLKDKSALSPHEVNPIYLKNIEVEND